MSRRARMAVVVMGYRNAATIERAVRSVVEQDAPEPFEVIVVTSGGDESASVVRVGFPMIRVVESDARLLPGGARNAGIAATDADLVAFLAADCTAMPGWVARRLHHHRLGRRAVAGAVVPGVDDGLVGHAAAYLLFPGRLSGHPEGPANHTQSFGLSYDRSLLDELGPFDATLRIGEDSVMVARLRTLGVTPWFDPAIRTAHPGPPTVRALLGDQYRRGRLRYEWEALKAPGRGRRRVDAARSTPERAAVAAGLAVKKTWRRARHSARESRAGADDRGTLLRAAPLVALGVVANQVGWGVSCFRGTLDVAVPPLDRDESVRRSLEPGDHLALTFDDQPGPATPALLDDLARLEVVATFFVTADRIRGSEDVVRRMVADGHAVGIHGMRHEALTELDADSLDRTLRRSAAALAEVTRWPVALLRPPDGRYDARVARAAADAELTTWLWTVDASRPGANGLAGDRLLDQLAPGAVVRLSGDGRDAPPLEQLVRSARERGYRFLALPAPRSLPATGAAPVAEAVAANG